ncbi:MAG: hypothetical protein JWQ33_1666, partial [Ramlibacter sp.]|nr:hypothetical protein [Ramlibacter sp.]
KPGAVVQATEAPAATTVAAAAPTPPNTDAAPAQ